MKTSTQHLIILILGITLIISMIMKYPIEFSTAITTGLIGFLANQTLTERQSKKLDEQIKQEQIKQEEDNNDTDDDFS